MALSTGCGPRSNRSPGTFVAGSPPFPAQSDGALNTSGDRHLPGETASTAWSVPGLQAVEARMSMRVYGAPSITTRSAGESNFTAVHPPGCRTRLGQDGGDSASLCLCRRPGRPRSIAGDLGWRSSSVTAINYRGYSVALIFVRARSSRSVCVELGTVSSIFETAINASTAVLRRIEGDIGEPVTSINNVAR